MNADSFAPHPERVPDTQPSPEGGPPNPPPRPPKVTARGLLDPGEPQRNILIGEVVVVKELAALLGLKPFMVVADVMAIGQFKNPDESIDFSTAASVARKHGYLAEKNF